MSKATIVGSIIAAASTSKHYSAQFGMNFSRVDSDLKPLVRSPVNIWLDVQVRRLPACVGPGPTRGTTWARGRSITIIET